MMDATTALSAVGGLVVAVGGALLLLDRAVRRTPPRWSASGRTVLITGASSGIGEELAHQYAQQGARLSLCARRMEELERVRRDIGERAPGAEVLLVRADVSRPADCARAVEETVERFGGVDLAVLNAGIGMATKFEDLPSTEPIHRVVDVNLFGVVDVCHAAMPHLLRSPAGRVAVVSSMAGKVGLPSRTGYSASKFAVQGFCEALALELVPRGVAVTLVCPGPVQTNIATGRVDASNGAQSFDMAKAQRVDDCGRQIVAAVARGDREAFIGKAGFRFKSHLLSYVRPLVPSLVDYLALKTVQKSGFLPPNDPCTLGFGQARLSP